MSHYFRSNSRCSRCLCCNIGGKRLTGNYIFVMIYNSVSETFVLLKWLWVHLPWINRLILSGTGCSRKRKIIGTITQKLGYRKTHRTIAKRDIVLILVHSAQSMQLLALKLNMHMDIMRRIAPENLRMRKGFVWFDIGNPLKNWVVIFIRQT